MMTDVYLIWDRAYEDTLMGIYPTRATAEARRVQLAEPDEDGITTHALEDLHIEAHPVGDELPMTTVALLKRQICRLPEDEFIEFCQWARRL